MEFVGKDFLKMQPPKGYKPGIGRGALGFSVRGNIGFDTKEPIDDGAADIYAQVDRRKQNKRKNQKQVEGQYEDAPPELPSTGFEIEEAAWLAIPEATDTTFRNKRLRKQQQSTLRSYNLPDSLINFETSAPNFSQQTKTDPQNPNGWIGYAKQLQGEQQFKKARSTILKGCKKCSGSCDVWLTAIDLDPSLEGKRDIAARAVDALPQSIQVWEKAVEIEEMDTNKLKVVHKAIEQNPECDKFWAQAATLEPDVKTRKLVLEQAVALVPASEQLWLLYYAVSPISETLDKALDILPHSVSLWSFKLFTDGGSRKEYLKQLVDQVPHGDWAGEINAQEPLDGASQEIAELLIEKFEISPDDLDEVTTKNLAFKYWAKRDGSQAYRKWAQQGNLDAIRTVLEEAHDLESFELLIKFDTSLEALERAYTAYPREFLDRYLEKLVDPNRAIQVLASTNNKTSEQWLKYANLLPDEEAINVLQQAIATLPTHGDLYIALDERLPGEHMIDKGLQNAPQFVELWLRKIRSTQQITKKRVLLGQAMAANPRNEQLWVERIMVEKVAQKDTNHLVETALNECRLSGKLWYLYLESIDDLKRKAKYAEALKRTNSAPEVLYSLAKFYKARGKDYKHLLEKAGDSRAWCENIRDATVS